MRTYGRQFNPDGTYQWVVVTTDANGYNDEVYLLTLVQCLKLNLGESPMFANYGIPAQQSVLTQVPPDYYTNQTVNQFRQYFASLTVQKFDAIDAKGNPFPAYQIDVVTNQGAIISTTLPV